MTYDQQDQQSKPEAYSPNVGLVFNWLNPDGTVTTKVWALSHQLAAYLQRQLSEISRPSHVYSTTPEQQEQCLTWLQENMPDLAEITDRVAELVYLDGVPEVGSRDA